MLRLNLLTDRRNKRVLRWGLAAFVIALAGCNHGPTMVHVRGKVLFKDGSVPRGGVCVVRFEPTEEAAAEGRRTATGQIQSDGSFDAFTRRPGDGVIPGKYNVTFTVWKGPRDPTSLIAEKYTASASTPYKDLAIDDDVDDLRFEIEPASGGG